MQRRNQLLVSSKRDLIKMCKQNNISTKGCLAKMDYVGKILQHQKNQEIKKQNKKTKNKNNKTSNKKTAKSPKSASNKKKPKPKKHVVTTPKITIKVSAPSVETPRYSSSDNDNYSSDSSIELRTPEYIPARMSLTEVFDINIFQNEYKEKEKKRRYQKHIKWGYSPHPSDDAIIDQNRESLSSALSTISDLSPVANIPKFKPSNSMGIILDNEDANDQDFEEEKSSKYIESDPFKRIDNALAQYYSYFDRDDYYIDANTDADADKVNGDGNKGKFMAFCETHDLLDDDMIKKQFIENVDKNPADCPYVVFDDKFPLILMQDETEDEEKAKEMRLIEIYNVMEYCYHHGQSPYF